MKNDKAAGPSGWVLEMVKSTGGKAIDMIIGLLKRIIVEGVISADSELITIVSCYKGTEDALDRRDYRGFKLTDQILKIVQGITRSW